MAVLVARVALAVVFTWAAGSKLRSQSQTAEGFESLGLQAPHLLARIVPAGELVIVGLLLVVPVWGALVAFAVLGGFTVVLADVLRRGVTVNCRCFGGSSEQPVSHRSLVRNGALMAVAFFVVLGA